MESLRKKILAEGKAIGTDIIKVDGFLNHQIDIPFLEEIGKELGRRYLNNYFHQQRLCLDTSTLVLDYLRY